MAQSYVGKYHQHSESTSQSGEHHLGPEERARELSKLSPAVFICEHLCGTEAKNTGLEISHRCTDVSALLRRLPTPEVLKLPVRMNVASRPVTPSALEAFLLVYPFLPDGRFF